MSAIRWRRWGGLALALIALNASLTFVNVWPTPKVRADAALSPELAVVVLALMLAGRRADSLARAVVPALWLVLVIGRYLDVTAPGLYGRDFNIYWDAPHLGNVAAMLVEAAPVWQVLAAAVAAAAAMTAAWGLSRWAWRTVAAAAIAPRTRWGLGLAAAAVVAGFLVVPADDRAMSPQPFARPVSAAYARQLGYALALLAPDRAVPALAASPALDRPLATLDGADVVLAFVEAYGAIAFDRPALAAAAAGGRDALASSAATAGRVVVSAFVESPTFGASSWLAHLSLLTGVEARDQHAYVAIMRAGRDSVTRAFARQGYRTVAVMPGLRQPWPEGAFYGFDQVYDYARLSYEGPRFGWWTIPDQFSLARLAQRELVTGDRPPVFAVFPTGTTHAPFGPVPPYQPDWSRVLTAEPFDAADVEAALATPPDLTNLSPSYARAVDYALRAFAGFVREQAGARQVLILIGDHQPVAAVTGPAGSLEVPVHVIASPGPIVDRLRAAGFAGGVTPVRPSLGPMHTLTTVLLDAFR